MFEERGIDAFNAVGEEATTGGSGATRELEGAGVGLDGEGVLCGGEISDGEAGDDGRELAGLQQEIRNDGRVGGGGDLNRGTGREFHRREMEGCHAMIPDRGNGGEAGGGGEIKIPGAGDRKARGAGGEMDEGDGEPGERGRGRERERGGFQVFYLAINHRLWTLNFDDFAPLHLDLAVTDLGVNDAEFRACSFLPPNKVRGGIVADDAPAVLPRISPGMFHVEQNSGESFQVRDESGHGILVTKGGRLAMFVWRNKTLAFLQGFEFRWPPRKTMKPEHAPDRRRPKNELISSNGIAREIGRSTRGVIDTLVRLEIEPEHSMPGVTLYRRDVIDTVREAMRAPNKTAVESTATGH